MRFWGHVSVGMILALVARPSDTFAQKAFEYGGFFEATVQIFPIRPNPSDTHALAAGQLELWGRGSIEEWLSWRASWDFRLDTHGDVERDRWFDLDHRSLHRPAGSLRELYLDAKLGPLDLQLGQQEVLWGRADGFRPTDNVTPYDYLNIATEERVPVPAVKADTYVGNTTLEAVWVPFFTPTRLPLLNQRWFPPLPESAEAPLGPKGQPIDIDLSFQDGSVTFPAWALKNGEVGLRWNQLVPGGEFSLSYFDGFDHIASFRSTATILPAMEPRPRALVTLNREYHRVRVGGADFASALGPFGLRGEIAYFAQNDPTKHDRLVFIVGFDRTWGDWFAILQYTDQILTGSAQMPAGNLQGSLLFPDQGYRSTILYRVARTLSSSQSVEIKGAIGARDGGFLVQPLYSMALTDAWRLKVGVTFFGGSRTSYLGQYHDNVFLNLQLRYTF